MIISHGVKQCQVSRSCQDPNFNVYEEYVSQIPGAEAAFWGTKTSPKIFCATMHGELKEDATLAKTELLWVCIYCLPNA